MTTNVEAFLRNPADLLLLEEKDKLGIKFGVGVSPRDLVQLNDIAQEVKGQKSGTHPVRFERRPDDYVDVDVRSFAKVNNAIVTAMVRDAAEADGKIWETLDEDERDHYRNVVQKNLAVYKQARAEYLKGNPTSDFAKGSQKEKIELP